MDGAINFTYTFSNGIEWHWPIALYLLLAGMSGGALVVSLLIKFYKKHCGQICRISSFGFYRFVKFLGKSRKTAVKFAKQREGSAKTKPAAQIKNIL